MGDGEGGALLSDQLFRVCVFDCIVCVAVDVVSFGVDLFASLCACVFQFHVHDNCVGFGVSLCVCPLGVFSRASW